jgi:peroxiredoxin
LPVALILLTLAHAATLTDHHVSELAARIRLLALKETPAARADTMLRLEAVLAGRQPAIAVPAASFTLTRFREAIRSGAGRDELQARASALLSEIEHSGDDPAAYDFLARAIARHDLSAGTDNPSVRSRIALVELATLLRTDYDFNLPDVEGRTFSLRDLKGRVVVLSFWATWCAPCQAEMPFLDRLAADGGEVVAISDEDPATVRAFLNAHRYRFRVLIDTEKIAAKMFDVKALPATRILDASGRLRATARALEEWELRELLGLASRW